MPLGTDVGAFWAAAHASAGVFAPPHTFWRFAADSGHSRPLPLLPGLSRALATRDAYIPLPIQGDDCTARALGAVDRSALWRRAYCREDDAGVCYGTQLVGESASQEQPVKVHLPAFLASQLD